MNILAHLYLSGGINNVMLGNYMGDFVKGKTYLNYSGDIKKGILLHRQIDVFADKHKAHLDSRNRFRDKYGLYSGVVVDIIYDYFLANQWDRYHNEPLEQYAQKIYAYLKQHINIFPLKLQEITPVLIKNNWFLKYSTVDGIKQVLTGMSNRTSLPNNTDYAIHILKTYKNELNYEFNKTITDLLEMVEKSEFLPKIEEKQTF